MVDPTSKAEFGEFAIEVWKTKAPNLRRVLKLWHTYLEHAVPEEDVRHDPASRLVIALVAHHMGVGIQDINAPGTAADEIRRARN